MASVPSACQSLADLVASLEQQYTDSAAKAAGLSGAQAWSALGQLGSVLAQLTDARDRLDECVKTNSAALIGNVIVMDASGAGAAAGAQTAILWELADTGPTARDTTQVQDGTFGFNGPIPTSAAITLHSTDASDLAGPDYRSGQLPGELGGQPLRLEMVYGPRLTLTAGVLQRLASQFPPTTQTLTAPATLAGLGPATVTVNNLTIGLAEGSLALTATGTLGAAALPTTPFSGSVSLVALPSDAPDAGDLVQVILAGANPVQISLPVSPASPRFSACYRHSLATSRKRHSRRGFINPSLGPSPGAWRWPSFRSPPPCHFAVSRSTSRASPSNPRSASSEARCRASILRRSHRHSRAASPGERRLPAATRAGEAVMAALVHRSGRADALSALAHPANGATSKSHARSTRAKRKSVARRGDRSRYSHRERDVCERIEELRRLRRSPLDPADDERRQERQQRSAPALSRHLGRPGLISRTRGAPPFVHASERRRVQASNARPGRHASAPSGRVPTPATAGETRKPTATVRTSLDRPERGRANPSPTGTSIRACAPCERTTGRLCPPGATTQSPCLLHGLSRESPEGPRELRHARRLQRRFTNAGVLLLVIESAFVLRSWARGSA